MNDTAARVAAILAAIYLPRGVELWLNSPNAHLGHRSPNDLIARGYATQVIAEAERLAGGNW